MRETRIGCILHDWPKAGAARIELEEHVLHLGDSIHVRGPRHDFVQVVESLEIDHRAKSEGWPGERVAIGVAGPVSEEDEVFVIDERAP